MRLLLCALLLTAACKSGDKKPAATTDNATPTERAGNADGHARRRPSLPGAADSSNVVQHEQPRDFSDPEVRAEMEERREERRKRMDEQLDTNHDGVVSDEERQARLKPMYERLDTNGDGKLTPDELASNQNRRMAFDDPAAIDTNKDGEISLGELDAAVTARREQMREKWRGRGGRFGGFGDPAGGGKGGDTGAAGSGN